MTFEKSHRYVAGTTPVRYWEFFAAHFIGTLKVALLDAYLGSLLLQVRFKKTKAHFKRGTFGCSFGSLTSLKCVSTKKCTLKEMLSYANCVPCSFRCRSVIFYYFWTLEIALAVAYRRFIAPFGFPAPFLAPPFGVFPTKKMSSTNIGLECLLRFLAPLGVCQFFFLGGLSKLRLWIPVWVLTPSDVCLFFFVTS